MEEHQQAEPRRAYEPPRLEDVDTGHSPAEVAGGATTTVYASTTSTTNIGVEESGRWH